MRLFFFKLHVIRVGRVAEGNLPACFQRSTRASPAFLFFFFSAPCGTLRDIRLIARERAQCVRRKARVRRLPVEIHDASGSTVVPKCHITTSIDVRVSVSTTFRYRTRSVRQTFWTSRFRNAHGLVPRLTADRVTIDKSVRRFQRIEAVLNSRKLFTVFFTGIRKSDFEKFKPFVPP